MTSRTDTIRRILAELGHLADDPATLAEESSLYAAGLTSHASVNVMLALEDEFDIEFPDRYLKRSTFESIGNLRDALDSLLSAEV